MSTVPKSANSLSTLLGQYMSDSENEDDDREKSASIATTKSIDSFLSEIASSTQNQSNLATYWTECLDKTTGHPYYWNTETKEVTWDKPAEYVEYLNNMRTAYAVLPQDSWSIGYSDDAKTPYYVNEITRVVSWEKPANFKEKPLIIVQESTQTQQLQQKVSVEPANTASLKLARKKLERKMLKKTVKKNLPKHLQRNSDDDEKIELISAYSEPVDSSSEEESTAKETKVIGSATSVKSPQINLVAAYATDSDSDGEKEDSKQGRVIGSKKKNKNGTTSEIITIESDSVASTTQPVVLPLKINTNSFASIITGGKTNNSAMDEELNKFKEELEKDMQLIDVDVPPPETSETVKEQSFDEKTFQRKRRIEFKTKSTDEHQHQQQRPGFGYADSKTESSTASSKPKYISFQKSHVEFEQSKSSTEESSTHGQQTTPPPESSGSDQKDSNRAECKTEIDDLCDVITGKVKFLSVGKPDVSAVQIMSIQLETLQAAFRASCLDSDYFFKWLKTTSDDLLTLEQHAAPDGWECKWDRENSQYCYKNLTTNAMQWEFPYDTVQDEVEKEEPNTTKTILEPEKIRADDEMDISTTPPPPSPPIISAHSTSLIWDQDHFTTKPPEPSEPSTHDDTTTRPNDISGELASFYSDIASLDPIVAQPPEIIESQDNKSNDAIKRAASDEIVSKKLKKRKKIKVPGLGSKMQEVSSMVANWQKAQKELGS